MKTKFYAIVLILASLPLMAMSCPPTRTAMTDVNGYERVLDRQCELQLFLASACQQVTHTGVPLTDGSMQYVEEDYSYTENPGLFQRAGSEVVHGVAGAASFDDKADNVNVSGGSATAGASARSRSSSHSQSSAGKKHCRTCHDFNPHF